MILHDAERANVFGAAEAEFPAIFAAHVPDGDLEKRRDFAGFHAELGAFADAAAKGIECRGDGIGGAIAVAGAIAVYGAAAIAGAIAVCGANVIAIAAGNIIGCR